MHRLLTLSLCLCFLSPAWLVAQAPTAPAANKSKSLAPLLEQANGALNGGDFKAARDGFSDVLTIDPQNAAALKGLGMSYLQLKEYIKASPILDKAVAAAPADRVAVYNAAAADAGDNNAMRGAKLLKDYLTAHPKDLDEPMANALAIVLGKADDQARKNSFFQTAVGFYKTYNAKLEAAAPGMKRWGLDWLPAADVTQKTTDSDAKQKEANDIATDINGMDNKLASARSDLATTKQRYDTGFDDEYTLRQAQQRVDDLEDKKNARVTDYKAALAAVVKPTLPDSLNLMTEETMPPAGLLATATAATPAPAKVASTGTIKPRHRVKKIPTPPSPSDSGSGDPPIVAKKPAGESNDTPSTPAPTDPPPAVTPDTPAVPETAPPAKAARIVQYAAAFPIAPDLLVTAAAPVNGASKIELTNSDGTPIEATVVRTDDASGLALLRMTGKTATYLTLADDFKGGAVQCAAFPSVNIFNPAAELINGTAPAPADGWKVRLSKHPRLPGAPLLVNGKIVGVQIARRDAESAQLPAATLAQLRTFLGSDLPATPGTATAVSVMLQLSATKGG